MRQGEHDPVLTETIDKARDSADEFRRTHGAIRKEIGRMMVGQGDVIDGALTAILAGGHVLLEGVPGLGKTMLISSISRALDLPFSRIQFTPDMMPADILGTSMLTETADGGTELSFQEGPIVANLVLADEINRATPKTQSALLEVMQEQQVTVGRRTIRMPQPFCVMATQNPVDQEGTYPLPEAQLDRFLMKLKVGYPSEEDYHTIIARTTGEEVVDLHPVSDGDTINRMRQVVRQVPVPDFVRTYAIRLVMATQPGNSYAPREIADYVDLGASPRGIQSLMLSAKVVALLDGRFSVACEDVAQVAHPVLRHRIVTNFHAQADKVDGDAIVDAILKAVQQPS